MLTKEIQSVYGLKLYYDENSTKETLLEVIKALEAKEEDIDDLREELKMAESDLDESEKEARDEGRDKIIAEEQLADIEGSLDDFKKDIKEADTYVKFKETVQEFIDNID